MRSIFFQLGNLIWSYSQQCFFICRTNVFLKLNFLSQWKHVKVLQSPWVSRWRRKSYRENNFLSHISQTSWAGSCRRKCMANILFDLNSFWQTGQRYCFSTTSWWVIMCSFKSLPDRSVNWQTKQRNTLPLSTKCTFSWRSNEDRYENRLPHIEQVNISAPPSCFFRCWLRYSFDVDKKPQISHLYCPVCSRWWTLRDFCEENIL